jgi:nucleotide-binding universal stress UspA family protein
MDQSNGNKIVVGLDRSAAGDHALREAMRLARQLPDSELHIGHVIETQHGLHDAARLEQLSAELRSVLEEVREHVRQVCAPAHGDAAFTHELVFHIRLGDPAEALHQIAVDVNADLIVVGTHGRHGVERLIQGSVAETLARTAHVSVLIAHPKDFAALQPSDRTEASRPNEELHPTSTGLSHRLHLEFRPRTTHISGLI